MTPEELEEKKELLSRISKNLNPTAEGFKMDIEMITKLVQEISDLQDDRNC